MQKIGGFIETALPFKGRLDEPSVEFTMKLTVALITEPITPPPNVSDPETGAIVDFSGTVRGEESGQPISALRYEAYESMALSEITRLLRELAVESPCQSALVIHRHGWIPVGETAIFVRIESRHRKEAFAMLSAFMDRLKLDVPIWKVESRKA